jgi:pyruvate dehydrogenase E2 component (dihydrolipoamide acetyltransferase)
MSENIVMPKLGMTMTEGMIEEWYKEIGDSVEKGEAVLTISSEKLTQDVESPDSGVLLSRNFEEGDEAEVGAVIGAVGEESEESGEAGAEKAETEAAVEAADDAEGKKDTKPTSDSQHVGGKQEKTSTNNRKRLFITPLARKMSNDKDLKLELIDGTGGNGRITKLDIQRVEKNGYDHEPEKQSSQVTQPTGTASIGEGLTPMRKVIARNMRESLANTAQLTLHRKAKANKLIEMQQKLRNEIEEADLDIKMSVTVLIARAAVLALRDYKKINSTYQNGKLVEYDEVHLGIATSLDEGLLVPVVKDAHQKTIGSLAKEIREVSTQAREGAADQDLLSGSTFTITNMGATGVEYFTPILNSPESGILGVGALQEELTLNNQQEVEMEKVIPFSLTFDHQILDGADAAEFLSILIKYIEAPNLLVL